MDKKTAKTREKKRDYERRKEKSRDAARCRRSLEMGIFTELAQALPLSEAIIATLDKASVMRLAISLLRVRTILDAFVPMKSQSDKNDPLFLKALDGFLIVMSHEGDIVFISDDVNKYLGLSQVELMGQSVYEICHPCDHAEVREMLTSREHKPPQCSFFLRFKCTLTSRGRSVNLKSASYKVIHCKGQMIEGRKQDNNENKNNNSSKSRVKCEGGEKQSLHQWLVAVGEPVPHPANIETPLGRDTFLSKHALDLKFAYVDDNVTEFLQYQPEDLLGKSVFDFHHAQDSKAVDKAFKALFSKGQTQTEPYRFLACGGGYIWVLTQATLIYNKGRKPDSVVCISFVISGVEHKEEVYSCSQLIGGPTVPALESAKPLPQSPQPKDKPFTSTAKVFVSLPKPSAAISPQSATLPPPSLRPQAATSKIFAPKTKDMNKGFLMFSDDESGLTTLKDEPEDLTHLAPTAGDVCVPLTSPYLGDMLDHFILPHSYSPLLSEAAKDAPFYSYRDELSSSGSLSPALTQSPGGCSLPSLCSLGDESPPLEDTTMSTLLGLDLVESGSHTDELSMRAPYIPMSSGEDLPLLNSADLMWGAALSPLSDKQSSRCAWSPPPPEKLPPQQKPDLNSSLAKLLRAEPRHPAKSYDHGGGGGRGVLTISYKKGHSEGERRKRHAMGSGTERSTTKRSKHQPGIGHPGVIDGGGRKPSVLMNLLVSGCDDSRRDCSSGGESDGRTRLKSLLLIDPEGTVPSLLDLTEQDYDVNAPVGQLLQGAELLTALDVPI